MADITLTAALRSNLLSLQGTQKLLDSTQLKLASGRKVNSALDDPTAFFASQSLTNRASDLNQLLDGMGQSIQTLKAADEGITSLTSLVNQAKSIAQTARDQATGAAVARSNDITAANLADLTAAVATTGDTFTLQAGTANPTTTFTISAGMSASDLVNQINSTSGFSAQLVSPSGVTATSRRIEIRTTNGEDLITTDTDGFLAAVGGITVGTTAATGQPPEDQVQLETDFNAVMTQIDELVQDTGYRGTNLLNGDSLVTQFNEDNTSSLTISGTTFDSAGLNISTANFADDNAIDGALDEIDAALNTLRAQARTFGSNLTIIQTREDFTKNIVNTLKEGSDKLTLADQNEEGAKLLSLQTQQQLGITSLSLASQAQQSVLRLF